MYQFFILVEHTNLYGGESGNLTNMSSMETKFAVKVRPEGFDEEKAERRDGGKYGQDRSIVGEGKGVPGSVFGQDRQRLQRCKLLASL